MISYGEIKPTSIPTGFILMKYSKYVPETTETRYVEGNYIVDGYSYTVVVPETRREYWVAYSQDEFKEKFDSWESK